MNRRLVLILLLGLLALLAPACSGPPMQFVPCERGQACQQCRGVGNYRCPKCLGRGQERCTDCNGTGQARCTAWGCSNGVIRNFGQPDQTCTSCRGEGRTRCGDGPFQLMACNGTGWQECDKCGGAGLVDCGRWVPITAPQ